MLEQQQSEQKQKWYLALLCLQVIEADAPNTPNQKAIPRNVNGKIGTMKPIMQETDLC